MKHMNDYVGMNNLRDSYMANTVLRIAATNESPLMRLLPVSTRQRVIFTDLYDSMIFEFKVTPITVQ